MTIYVCINFFIKVDQFDHSTINIDCRSNLKKSDERNKLYTSKTKKENNTVLFRLFTVPYFPVRSSRSSAMRCGLPSWMSVMKIKMGAINI